jgi:tetratricopeptide (TPR) repeat protein
MVLCNYARCLRELGRLDEAADYAERAYAKAQQVGLEIAVNYSLLARAKIYTSQGKTERAAAMFTEVQPRLEKSLPPGHYGFASLASAQALNVLAQGDVATALKLADQAVAIDEATIQAGGEGSYYMPTLLINRARVELEAGRPHLAVDDATRALTLLQTGSKPGIFSSIQGGADLALGRALRTQGKLKEAKTAFESAAEHLRVTVGPDHPDTRQAQLARSASLSHSPHRFPSPTCRLSLFHIPSRHQPSKALGNDPRPGFSQPTTTKAPSKSRTRVRSRAAKAIPLKVTGSVDGDTLTVASCEYGSARAILASGSSL